MNQIGNYQILNKLGEGGMGTVFEGRDLTSGKSVAIKVVRSGMSSEKRIQSRFKREIEVSKKFAHPFVIKTLDGGFLKSQSCFYLVMEFLEGENLKTLFREYPATPREARTLYIHCAEALSYIHSFGVIHRDIKPENIVAASEDRTVLLDFGLALAEDLTRLSQTSDRPGTWLTMAPEQLSGGIVDGRSDIYSLGVTMYWLLTGKLPFTNDQILGLAVGGRFKAQTSPHQHNKRIPEHLSDIVMRSIEPDPELRFSDANTLLKALSTGTSEEVVAPVEKSAKYSLVTKSNTKNAPLPDNEMKTERRRNTSRIVGSAISIALLGSIAFYSSIQSTTTAHNISANSKPLSERLSSNLLKTAVADNKRDFAFRLLSETIEEQGFTSIKDSLNIGAEELYNDIYPPDGVLPENAIQFARAMYGKTVVPEEKRQASYFLINALIRTTAIDMKTRIKLRTEAIEICKKIKSSSLPINELPAFALLYSRCAGSLDEQKECDLAMNFIEESLNNANLTDEGRMTLNMAASKLLRRARKFESMSFQEITKAVEFSRKAYEIAKNTNHPQEPYLRIDLVRILTRDGKRGTDEALRHCRELVKEHPEQTDSAEYVLTYASVLASSLKFEQALHELERVRILDTQTHHLSPQDKTQLNKRIKEYKKLLELISIKNALGIQNN